MFGLSLLLVVLLASYDAALAVAPCSHTFLKAPGHIRADAQLFQTLGHRKCEFVVRAPPDHVVVLNVTLLYGWNPPSQQTTTPDPGECVPALRIAAAAPDDGDSATADVLRLCWDAALPRFVAPASHVVRLTFLWRLYAPSGFALHFDFRPRRPTSAGVEEKKEAIATPPYLDISRTKANSGPTEQGGTASCTAHTVSSIQIIIVVIAIVLTLGIVTCVVSHYKMGARSWSERWNRPSSQQPLQQSQHHHRGDLHAATVLYVSAATQERMQRENASLQDRQTRMKSVQVDTELNLPPSIPLPDGEEQPYDSLQHLHLRNPDQESEIYRECVCAPPNRTVFDGESPPPYRPNPSTVGFLKRAHAAAIVRSHNNNSSASAAAACNGNHSNGRSHSPHLPPVLAYHHQAAASSSQDARHPPEGEPPPGYGEVLANPNIYSSLHHPPSGGV